jgi:uncharacterized protein YbjT (DUF2867 family)
MNEKHCILIVGATGTVGREVLKAASSRGLRIRVLVRSRVRVLELPEHVEIVEGDLSDPIAVQRSLEGVSAAFYLSPHLDDEEKIAEQFTVFCNARSIRMVFVGVHVDGANRLIRWIKRTAFGIVMGHYKAKLRLSESVRQLGSDVVILMPTNFYQNDELIRASLLQRHVFAQPLGFKGINRVDSKDIGEAAVRALTDISILAGAYPVVGPESLTGPQCASVWGDAIGQSVTYCEDDAVWEPLVKSSLEGKKLIDILNTYRLIRKLKLSTTPKQVAATQKLLGRPPRSYQTYVEETFEQWRSDSDF